ncbi:hypothetical protein FOA26_02035 [Bacillus velezensis]|uniref:hypothetical protein n=1 Tax=Bacillus velezensis TaxID=492670 RepID=UPI0016893C5E|nr:hypothetical protein [Bacillus velezensis]QNV52399.1 hypothetical protein GE573_01323 [Bacillus velezensis]
MNIYYRKTVVGWWNIYPAGSVAKLVNLSPEEFFTLLPQISRKAVAGCTEIKPVLARELFGEEVQSA